MAFGNKNVATFTINGPATFTGSGSGADIVGFHFIVPFNCKIVRAYAVCTSFASGGTSALNVRTGTTDLATFALTDAILSAAGTSLYGSELTRGTELKLYSNTSAHAMTFLSVIVDVRVLEA